MRETDFTQVIPSPSNGHVKDNEFYLRVQLDSCWMRVAVYSTQKEAEDAEFVINKVMIEYRTKRNAYEKASQESFREAACADPANYTGPRSLRHGGT